MASGVAYAGLGVTPTTPSATVAKYNESGNFVQILRDYSSSVGDSPTDIMNYNDDHILVLVENTAGRRIEIIAKDGSGYSTLFGNTALSGIVRSFVFDYSGGLLISESTGIEKFTVNGTRISFGANAYVTNPIGTGNLCATTTSTVSKIVIGPQQQIIYSHAFTAASTNNKIVMIDKGGYVGNSSCLAAQAAPSTAHFPTSLLLHSSGKLLASFSNNTGSINDIYSYTVGAASFSNATLAFNDISVLQGVSEMIELPDGTILIASANPTFNTVERFSVDSVTGVLTRIGTQPFLAPSVFTRSISGMLFAN